MIERNCGSCKHWQATCKHGVLFERSYCSGWHDDCSRYDAKNELQVQTPSTEVGGCARGDSADGDPSDEATLMWGRDASGYRARVVTRRAFTCPMWQAKDGASE